MKLIIIKLSEYVNPRGLREVMIGLFNEQDRLIRTGVALVHKDKQLHQVIARNEFVEKYEFVKCHIDAECKSHYYRIYNTDLLCHTNNPVIVTNINYKIPLSTNYISLN